MIDRYSTALDVAAAIRRREVSSTEVVRAELAHIEANNPRINAIITLDAERALEQAAAADARITAGEALGPLHGVPFTLKDAHETAGLRTTVGAPPLADHVPAKDGTVAARLKAAGAVLLGKTNVPPFLMSAQTNNPLFGRTSNPWDVSRTCGGSSGGSAAAVAAGLACFDIGSDASGSIRIPAHFCGVFGLKPTAHRIPNTGHIPPPPGVPRPDRILATPGPLARSVADLAVLLGVLAGPDGIDTEVPPVPVREIPRTELRGLRVGFRTVFPGVPTSSAVRAVVERAVRDLSRAGAQVYERDPAFTTDELNAVWVDYMRAFASIIAETVPGVELPLLPKDVPKASAADMTRILSRRDALVTRLDALFDDLDVYLTPASICTAFEHSPPRSPIPIDGTLVESRFIDHYLYPFSFTGNPAVVVPAGLAGDGLPAGVQLVGRRWHDERLLGVAQAVTEVLGGFARPGELA
jgi:amidase